MRSSGRTAQSPARQRPSRSCDNVGAWSRRVSDSARRRSASLHSSIHIAATRRARAMPRYNGRSTGRPRALHLARKLAALLQPADRAEGADAADIRRTGVEALVTRSSSRFIAGSSFLARSRFIARSVLDTIVLRDLGLRFDPRAGRPRATFGGRGLLLLLLQLAALADSLLPCPLRRCLLPLRLRAQFDASLGFERIRKAPRSAVEYQFGYQDSTWRQRRHHVHVGAANRHSHPSLHRHRGLDALARGDRRAATQTCSRSIGPCCATRSRGKRRRGRHSGRRVLRRLRSRHDAVAAAGAAQRDLADGPVRVRMASTRASPSSTAEGYVGADVHRAARIMSAGHGGQVLVSETTQRLLGPGVELRDLGDHRLKDLGAPLRLYQLGSDELPSAQDALPDEPPDPGDADRRPATGARGGAGASPRPSPADPDRAGRQRQDAARAAARGRSNRAIPRRRLLGPVAGTPRPGPGRRRDRRGHRRRRRP